MLYLGQEGRPAATGARLSLYNLVLQEMPALFTGVGYFFVAAMTPKTTTAITWIKVSISNVVMLSPPRRMRFGGLAVSLLLGLMIAHTQHVCQALIFIF